MAIEKDLSEKQCLDLILEGVHFMLKEKLYSQKLIVCKMKAIDYGISEPSLTNMLKGRKVGKNVLRTASGGVQEILRREFGLSWQKNRFVKRQEGGWQPEIILCGSKAESPGFIFHENGRLSLPQKVAFIADAQREIIELGVTLSTFTSYFYSRKEEEFRQPITHLLSKGISYKCYLLQPDSNEANLYFEDRGHSQSIEKRGSDRIRESLEKLAILQQEFSQSKYPGSFEIYTYKHIPYSHFLVVDGGSTNARMMISSYIYGELRANCPIIELTRKSNPGLFLRYRSSLQKLVKGAKPYKK